MSVRAMPAEVGGRALGTDSVSASERARMRAFNAARRHSQLVRVLRSALILGAVGGVATLAALTLYRTFGSALGRLSIGVVSIDGTKVTMDRPRLTGARPDGGGYVINAAKAIQDIRSPTDVDLVDIDGDIVPPDRDTTHLTATSGHYDSERERLELSGDVRLKNSRYTVELRSAHIEFKTGAYSSREPVTVVTSTGASIVADSALARDNGKEIEFAGHVHSVFRSNAGDSAVGQSLEGAQP